MLFALAVNQTQGESTVGGYREKCTTLTACPQQKAGFTSGCTD